MTKARDLANLLDGNGDVNSANLDNVPASNNASALTTGTLPNARLPNNISDGGSTGTKIAVGTTAQRGSTAGEFRYNSTTTFFEGINTNGSLSVIEPTPTVSSVDVNEVNNTAGGNQTIVVTGQNFKSGGTIAFVGSSATFNASSTTFNSATQVTAVAPKSSFLNAQEPYTVKFTTTTGISGSSASGLINIDSAPTFGVASGSLGTLPNANRASSGLTTVTGSDAEGDSITFAVTSGSIPTGITFNSNGTWSGTANEESSATTYNFTITATAGGKTTARAYSIIVQAQSAYPFTYTGSNQTFTVPSGITSFQIFMWGAGGGGGNSNTDAYVGGNGGAGNYVTATISNYSAGQTFSLLVGGANYYGTNSTAIANYGGGGSGTGNSGSQGPGGNGGGRTEFSIGGGANTPGGTRILVAGAGGGGAGSYYTGEADGNRNGGNAGHPTGGQGGGTNTIPTGGTQSAGGSAGSGNSNSAWASVTATAGVAGIGGMGTSGSYNQDIGYGRPGGGGGGYYGGGGGSGGNSGAITPQGGAGGSSYANTSYASSITHTSGNQETAPQTSSTHYAGGAGAGGTGDRNGVRHATSLGGNGRIVLFY